MQYLKKKVRDQADFLYVNKHQSVLQGNTIAEILVGIGDQGCLKYLKQQACNILVIEIDVFYCRISQGSTC